MTDITDLGVNVPTIIYVALRSDRSTFPLCSRNDVLLRAKRGHNTTASFEAGVCSSRWIYRAAE